MKFEMHRIYAILKNGQRNEQFYFFYIRHHIIINNIHLKVILNYQVLVILYLLINTR